MPATAPFVEIPLKSYHLRFRVLPWVEESRLHFPPKADRRRVVLTHALADISGLKINSQDESRRVLAHVPDPALDRMWVLYRGNLPEDRAFGSGGDLYTAPDPAAYNKRLIEDEAPPDDGDDPAIGQLRREFGNEAARDARELHQAMLRNAAKAGTLTRANTEEAHGEDAWN